MFSTLLLAAAAPYAPQAQFAPVPPRAARRTAVSAPAATPGGTAFAGGTSTGPGPGLGSGADRPAQPFVPTNDYSVSTFGYTDPNDPDFNVLGGGAFATVRRDESILIPWSGTLDDVRREDEPSNYSTSAFMIHGGASSFEYDLQDAEMGDFFGDGKQRAVTASRVLDPSDPTRHHRLSLRIWQSDGQHFIFAVREVLTDFPVADEVHMAVGDVDGDGLDEVVVSVFDLVIGLPRMLVVDDAVDGDWSSGAPLTPLADTFLGAGSDPSPIACGQFDGDTAEEIAFFRPVPGVHRVGLVDDANHGLAHLGTALHQSSASASTVEGTYVVAFDHDGDGVDVVGTYFEERLFVTRYDAAAGTFERFGGSRSIDSMGPIALTEVDRAGNGRETLAFIDARVRSSFPVDVHDVEIDELTFGATGVWTGRNLARLDTGPEELYDADLVALDDDGDGQEELRAAAGVMWTAGGTRHIFEFNYDGDVYYTRNVPVSYSFVRGDRRLALVAGDDDGESVVVRWTGEKYLNLSQPMPIALMEAVPTKAGIGQNYTASGSTFTQGATGTTSFATSAGMSVSGTYGVSSPSFFDDVFGVEASTTITDQVARTTGIETSVRSFVTYGASYDAHTIVFQGTLYMSYVYEIVRAQPGHGSAVGSLITLNVPVSTGAWKWELDFFNQVFPQGAIDPGVAFGHLAGATVIGDPSSYIDRAELESYVSGAGHVHDGWIGNSTNVGQGGGAITIGLELSTQASTTTERTVSVETTAGVTVGPYSFGGTVGISDGTIYTVATAEDTSYTATIGDIADPGEWTSWAYGSGMVIYQERDAFFAPVQVMRYWVDPFGTAYP